MSFRFIEDHRDTYPVWLMCAVPDWPFRDTSKVLSRL